MNPDSQISSIPVQAAAPVQLPTEFNRLEDLAYNLWWTWDMFGHRLWSRIDPRRWSENRNPLSLLQGVDTEIWETLAADDDFTELYMRVLARFDAYMSTTDTWYRNTHPDRMSGPIAYLCAEFGVHHTLPFYSGGLGVLAGDHTKAASDLGLPFFGIGVLYRRGYFRQSVDPDGNQQHQYNRLEMTRRPFREVLDRKGRPLRVSVPFPGRDVQARAWRIDVGRVPLMLLDTQLAENDPADRPITNILYVRGREMRLAQELVLGIGASRLIAALGIEPAVWHVNEGHAAFSLLDRVSRSMSEGVTFDDARKLVQQNTLFTLHTPVAAGNEVFDGGLVEHHLSGALEGIPDSSLRELGTAPKQDDGRFDLGALAIRLSSMTNGVSKRHGEVVSDSWARLIGGPAHSVTNGAHPQSWVGSGVARLYASALGENWPDRLTGVEAEAAIRDLDDGDVWSAHQSQKELLLRRLRGRLLEQFARHGASPDDLRSIDDQLPASRLTIVFGRRFTSYKRAGLLLSDPGRARALLTNPERPVQVLFTGKAHPADREGQGLIRWVSELSKSPELVGHIYYIEDYDMQLGRWLVGGSDVWLNNPRPPLEASGTSGMKAAMNGVLNLSVLDGWWLEGSNGTNGWGFGADPGSDADDAAMLYHLLESQVVSLFYERASDGIPHGWVTMMKDAMATVTGPFSTQRMVRDYTETAYLRLGSDRSPGAR